MLTKFDKYSKGMLNRCVYGHGWLLPRASLCHKFSVYSNITLIDRSVTNGVSPYTAAMNVSRQDITAVTPMKVIIINAIRVNFLIFIATPSQFIDETTLLIIMFRYEGYQDNSSHFNTKVVRTFVKLVK